MAEWRWNATFKKRERNGIEKWQSMNFLNQERFSEAPSITTHTHKHTQSHVCAASGIFQKPFTFSVLHSTPSLCADLTLNQAIALNALPYIVCNCKFRSSGVSCRESLSDEISNHKTDNSNIVICLRHVFSCISSAALCPQ